MTASLVSIRRAARILAPLAGGVEAATHWIEDGLRSGELSPADYLDWPTSLVGEMDRGAGLSAEWFRKVQTGEILRPSRDLIEFITEKVLIRRDCIESFRHESRIPHWRERFKDGIRGDLSGENWSILQALAWFATQDQSTVDLMGVAQAWPTEADRETEPKKGDQAWVLKNARDRNLNFAHSKAVGWLVTVISRDHCKCGSETDDELEKWERCDCTNQAFEQLRQAIYVKYFDGVANGKSLHRAGFGAASLKLDHRRLTLIFPGWLKSLEFRAVDVVAAHARLSQPNSKSSITDDEVENWIRKNFQTRFSGQTFAWTAFKREFGERAGKKERFTQIWKDVTGNRGRGRPPSRKTSQ